MREGGEELGEALEEENIIVEGSEHQKFVEIILKTLNSEKERTVGTASRERGSRREEIEKVREKWHEVCEDENLAVEPRREIFADPEKLDSSQRILVVAKEGLTTLRGDSDGRWNIARKPQTEVEEVRRTR